LGLIVAGRQGFKVFDCCVSLGPSGTLLFAFERGAAAVAIDVDFENRGVVNQAIDGGQRHGGIRENLAPCTKWLIGGDQRRSPLVTGTDQLEQNLGFRLIFTDIGEIIEDQQVKAVEPVYGGLKRQFPAGHL
jgi:hypothetical protein